MVSVDNFVSKLYWNISEKGFNGEIKEYRLLGQEQDGNFLFAWIQSNKEQGDQTCIGLYSHSSNELEIVHTFSKTIPCVQASIDSTRKYLAFVTKEYVECDAQKFTYITRIIKLNKENAQIHDLQIERKNQIFVQFLYRKHSLLSEKQPIRLLVLLHKECILQYQLKINVDTFTNESFTHETIVKLFSWAQWDPVHQTLYYIHNRKPTKCLVEGEEEPVMSNESKHSPMLSGLQFHDDLPHESVLNIPLNLPHATTSQTCGIYEDDTIPLRIHDCSLDLIVLTDESGMVCICHHYLYQPIQPTTTLNDGDTSPVHFAYSVTILHKSCVIHCVIPGLPWNIAKTIRPLFKLIDNHMLVLIPEVCTHLLDIGLMHEPCCHVTLPPLFSNLETNNINLTSLTSVGTEYVMNKSTLDLLDITIPISMIIDTFKSDTVLENKLSIIHYLIVHRGEVDKASELITWQTENPLHKGFPQILKEFLIGTSYASVQKNLPSDASNLVNLLPITTLHIGCDIEVKINDNIISLSQDVLWNASMMLLSPQQRIIPYRSDIWVKLWEQLTKISKGKQRFRPSQVVEKLLVSLVCYQPEALSRSSTPMSPRTPLGSSSVLNDFLSLGGQCGRKNQTDSLPFYEIESCTASKQEHIISVNLRELSMHLLKQSSESKVTRFDWQNQTPMFVHAVATRYISAQLEQSRYLCHILCNAAAFDPRHELDKGFIFINQLREERRYILFTILERYYLAVESIAFPLPQGFTSFFTYLGYKTLRFEFFLQYVQRNVFELQVDVMKIIMADIDNSKTGIHKKLKLLTLLPRTRAKRLLNQWQHPISIMIRAREHALHILSGVESSSSRMHSSIKQTSIKGLTSFPTESHLSPLDTFLDLLTGKASLTDLDLGLLVEAIETARDVTL